MKLDYQSVCVLDERGGVGGRVNLNLEFDDRSVKIASQSYRDLAKRKHVIIRRREGKSEEREETNCDLQRERERNQERS